MWNKLLHKEDGGNHIIGTINLDGREEDAGTYLLGRRHVTYMLYSINRTGDDETTTTLTKRAPFLAQELDDLATGTYEGKDDPGCTVPSVLAVRRRFTKPDGEGADMYRATRGEIRTLTKLIQLFGAESDQEPVQE